MSALRFVARVAVLVAWVPIVWAAWLYDGAREAWHKKRLGSAYEGPLED